MSRKLKRICAGLLGVFAVMTMSVGCGSGGGLDAVLPPGVSSADIGPAGGTVTSFDGTMKMIVPPGALNTSKNITITQLNMSSLSPAAQGAQPKGAFSIGPSTLTFNLPVLIQWNVPLFEGALAASPVLDIITFNDQFIATETLKYVQGASMGVVEALIPGPGTVVRFGLAGSGGLSLDVTAPPTLTTGQTPGLVSPSLSVPGEAVGVNSSPIVQWGLDPLNSAGLAFGIPMGTQTPFAANTPLVSGQGTVLTDSASLTCTLDGSYTYRTNLALTGFDFPGLFQSRFGSVFGGMTTNYVIQVDLNVTCLPSSTGGGGGGTGSMPQVQVFSVPLPAMAGLRRVPSGFPLPTSANAAFHQVIVAYQDGAACIQAEDGALLYQTVAQSSGFYQAAAALPVPAGAQGNAAIVMTGGSGHAVFDVDTATGMPLSQGNVSSFSFQPDLILTDEDPSLGGFVVDGLFGELLPVQFVPPWQVATQGLFFGLNLDTGAASGTGALLLVGNQGFGGAAPPEGQFLSSQLYFVDPAMSTSGPISVATLGAVPGPLRGDPASGIHALVTAATGLLQVILWDGINAPSLGGSLSVGTSSVFVDVFGQFLAVSTPLAGGITLVEVDAQGQILSNTLIPLTGAQGSAAGIVFLRDAQNSVFVVTDASEGVLVTNAF